MKKFLVALLFLSLSISAAFAQTQKLKVGTLGSLNMTPQEYKDYMQGKIETKQEKTFITQDLAQYTDANGYNSLVLVDVKFYDSLNTMQMALEAGEIDVILLPESVAEYMMNVNPKYTVSGITLTEPTSFALGFRKGDDPDLKNKINEALDAMKLDGTLAILQAKYIIDPDPEDPEPVKFRKFENVDKKIKVAVTGDLPPIDFVAPDGTPAGFNTAVLAELGRRLNINIETVNIEEFDLNDDGVKEIIGTSNHKYFTGRFGSSIFILQKQGNEYVDSFGTSRYGFLVPV